MLKVLCFSLSLTLARRWAKVIIIGWLCIKGTKMECVAPSATGFFLPGSLAGLWFAAEVVLQCEMIRPELQAPSSAPAAWPGRAPAGSGAQGGWLGVLQPLLAEALMEVFCSQSASSKESLQQAVVAPQAGLSIPSCY